MSQGSAKKRTREELEWEEGVDLAEFCSTHLKNMDEASRADLRGLWEESGWLDGPVDKGLSKEDLAEEIEDRAYALWLEDKEGKLDVVDFIPMGGKRKGGQRPKTAKRYDGRQQFWLDELGGKAQTRDGNRAAAQTELKQAHVPPETIPELLHCEGVVFDPRNTLGLSLTGDDLAKMTDEEFVAFRHRLSLLMGDLAHWNHARAPQLTVDAPPSP